MSRKIIKWSGLILVFWFLIHTIYTIIDGLNNSSKKADIGVVFGNKVNDDGSLSERLKARLNESILLYNTNKIKKIIVSGGVGKEGFREGTEMKKHLLKNNIPSKDIIVDNHGNNSEDTVVNTIRIADSLNFKTIISISQYYHQTRIKKLFRKHSFQNIDSRSPIYFEFRDIYSLCREFFAYYFG